MKSIILSGCIVLGIECKSAAQLGKTVPTWQQIFAIVGIALILFAGLVYLLKRRTPNIREILHQYATEPTQAEITFVHDKNYNDQQVLETSHTIDKSVQGKNHLQNQLSVDDIGEKQSRNLSEVFKKKQGTKQLNTKKRLASAAKIVKSALAQVESVQDNDI